MTVWKFVFPIFHLYLVFYWVLSEILLVYWLCCAQFVILCNLQNELCDLARVRTRVRLGWVSGLGKKFAHCIFAILKCTAHFDTHERHTIVFFDNFWTITDENPQKSLTCSQRQKVLYNIKSCRKALTEPISLGSGKFSRVWSYSLPNFFVS